MSGLVFSVNMSMIKEMIKEGLHTNKVVEQLLAASNIPKKRKQ